MKSEQIGIIQTGQLYLRSPPISNELKPKSKIEEKTKKEKTKKKEEDRTRCITFKMSFNSVVVRNSVVIHWSKPTDKTKE